MDTNNLPQRLDVFRAFSFESAGALALNNEYSGFAATPAHYIAFAERKYACPCKVIYYLRRFTWHLNRISSSPRTSASIGQTRNMTSACRPPATPGASSTASLTRSRRIDEWAKSLHRRFGGPIAVALELARGPIVAALQKYDFFVLFPINPSTLAKYREAFRPSRAKDDPTDAELALELLLRHPERFAPLRPQSVAMRSLLSLVEQRRELVGDKTRFTNRLCDTLKQYYPQALEWFEERDTVLFCDFHPLADAGDGQARPQDDP